MDLARVAQLPGTMGQRLSLAAGLWVAGALLLALGGFWWQSGETGGIAPLQPALLVPGFAFAAASFGLRTLRWHIFLQAAGAKPPFFASLRTQLIGFSLTMTPGKLGELYKCYLMERETGIPTARTAPIVLFEKLMDGIAFTSLGLIAAASLPGVADTVSTGARSLLLFGIVALGVGVVLQVAKPDAAAGVLTRLLHRLPFGPHLSDVAGVAIRGGADVLQAPVLAQNMALSLVARTCDGLATTCAAWALGIALSPLAGVFVLNSAGALGGVSMLPGGIGVVETSMSVLFVSLGAAPSAAFVATFLARLLSFWLWVATGLVLLFTAGLRAGPEGGR